PFTRATTDELIHSFSRIAKGEKISVADDALYLIATLSDGSFRDGAKIFEEVVASVQEKNIDKKDVENLYNTLHVSSLVEIVVQAFIKKDLQAGLEALGKIESYGIDTAYFMDQLLSWLHSMLLQASGVKASKGEEPTQPFLPLSAIKDILKTVMKAEKEFRFAQLPQLPLEIALIEWCSKEAVVKEGVRQEPVTVENVSQPTTQQKPADTTFWYQIIDAIKEKNYTVAGVLRGCRLKLFDEKTFIIETQHLFHKEQLEKDTAKTLLHDVIKALSGKDVLVNVELRGGE
ncbi:MAG: hypothetical protein HYT10_00275, partial [Candidatus Levybacteria bacterium]|nr:hypothetical protein [Candidatus Levybacteria bacterium]